MVFFNNKEACEAGGGKEGRISKEELDRSEVMEMANS